MGTGSGVYVGNGTAGRYILVIFSTGTSFITSVITTFSTILGVGAGAGVYVGNGTGVGAGTAVGPTHDDLASPTLASTVASMSGRGSLSPHDTAANVASINTKATMVSGLRLRSMSVPMVASITYRGRTFDRDNYSVCSIKKRERGKAHGDPGSSDAIPDDGMLSPGLAWNP